MENGRQIRTQLAEKRLKLDSSPLHYEVGPTGPRPAQCVSERSLNITPQPYLDVSTYGTTTPDSEENVNNIKINERLKYRRDLKNAKSLSVV